MAHVAARAGLPLAANVTEVRPGRSVAGDAPAMGRQPPRGGPASTGRSAARHVAPHAVEPAAAAGSDDRRVAPVRAGPRRSRLPGSHPSRVPAEAGKISLADARVVVGGGRGVGSAEGFAQLEELAALLGGAVGVSRVVTSAGWRPHAEQVGQTGTRIAPDLYIACGISGAIQHMVGARSAKAILAINTDRDAPMVTRATYAVIGDLHTILPAIIAAVRAAR